MQYVPGEDTFRESVPAGGSSGQKIRQTVRLCAFVYGISVGRSGGYYLKIRHKAKDERQKAYGSGLKARRRKAQGLRLKGERW